MPWKGKLVVAGEDIEGGMAVMISRSDGKVYRAQPEAGEWVGHSVEQIREGLRVRIDRGEAREDDA